MNEGDFPVMAKMFAAAQRAARQEGLERTGYRLVINNGQDAGMEVWHLHLHVLGGRALRAMG
jgi:histidine triad (HIT) family protein